MTGARSYKSQRRREAEHRARTARKVSGASYMVRISQRPHVPSEDGFCCHNCGIVITPATTAQDCPGILPGDTK